MFRHICKQFQVSIAILLVFSMFAEMPLSLYQARNMNTVSIQMQTLYRSESEETDDEIGRSLTELVGNALDRGKAPSSAVVVRADRIDIIPLGVLIRSRIHVGAFLGGLSRSELAGAGPILCVGVMGRFTWRRHPSDDGMPVGMVFLEWSDGRWWHWRAICGTELGSVIEDTATLDKAADGLPKPSSLGGWWSLGRRRNLNVKLAPRAKADPKAVGPVQ